MSALNRARFLALTDLVLPRRCAGCDAPAAPGAGAPVCATCSPMLTPGAPVLHLDGGPVGLPPAWAAGAYAGVLRHAVLVAKERGRAGVVPLLSDLLGEVLLAATCVMPFRPLLVVPVPCSPLSRAHRRDDLVLRLTARAVAYAAGRGADLRVVPALRHVRRVRDQGDLGAAERAANLAGAFAVRRAYAPMAAGGAALIVDDVITTGATLREAARAVRACGGVVAGAAALAATLRRLPGERTLTQEL